MATSLRPLRSARRFIVGLLGWFAAVGSSCASSDPQAAYERGLAASKRKDWALAEKDLTSFVSGSCFGPVAARGCRDAELALARGYEAQERWAEAWAAVDNALGFPPHAKDAALKTRAEGLAAKLTEALPTSLDAGTPLVLRYRDESPEAFWVRSVTLSVDGQPVFNVDKGAQDLRAEGWTRAYQATVAPGDHALVAETSHACKPGQGTRCTAASLRRAWSFHCDAHQPLTLDLHAIVPDGEPARAVLEMQRH